MGRVKRFIIKSVLGLVFLGAAVYGSMLAIGFWLSPQNKLEKSDAIIAVSGGDTEERTQEAVKLYQEGWAPRLIFSGAAADPSSPSNAKVMEQMAEQDGVPASSISIDEQSQNTLENAIDVNSIVKKQGDHQVILVTSPYHQRRASLLFHQFLPGVTILNHSAPDKAWRKSDWWATSYSRQVTFDELQKSIFTMIGRSQLKRASAEQNLIP